MKNLVILIGNLGSDPDVRKTSGGDTVTTFRVATIEQWKDKSGQLPSQTEWHSCVAWRRLGEICGEYLSKGSKVYVEGSLKTRKWQDQSGNDRYITEIIAREMKILSPKSGTSGGGGAPCSDTPPMSEDSVPF